jgi:hypothetical protein
VTVGFHFKWLVDEPTGGMTVNIKTRLVYVTALGLASVALVSCDDRDEKADVPSVVAEPNKSAVVAQPSQSELTAKSMVPQGGLEKLPDPDGVRTWRHAVVKSSQKANLEEFDAKLRDTLGIANLEEFEIGCVEGCDKFSGPDLLPRIVYVFPLEYPDTISRFGAAWDATQRSVNEPLFRLEFDANVPPPTCTSHPQPCSPMAFCAGDACGRKPLSSSSCGAC